MQALNATLNTTNLAPWKDYLLYPIIAYHIVNSDIPVSPHLVEIKCQRISQV